MRTTLDLDDDVLQAAKELARLEKRTAGQVISALARRGLAVPEPRARRRATRHGVPVLPSRGDVITLEHVQRLRDEEGV
ncbi:MAG: antitoxin [Acidobacteria bacterium]|nr:MAG: antitoxin [Acidobacteriota bacterium]PYR51952.1 MAG: antitoxin [Acidobacteriota bacterium]